MRVMMMVTMVSEARHPLQDISPLISRQRF